MLDAALEGAQVPLLGSFLQIAEDRKNVGPERAPLRQGRYAQSQPPPQLQPPS
jgi:hypothetical protein